jgi:hypothetical protein
MPKLDEGGTDSLVDRSSRLFCVRRFFQTTPRLATSTGRDSTTSRATKFTAGLFKSSGFSGVASVVSKTGGPRFLPGLLASAYAERRKSFDAAALTAASCKAAPEPDGGRRRRERGCSRRSCPRSQRIRNKCKLVGRDSIEPTNKARRDVAASLRSAQPCYWRPDFARSSNDRLPDCLHTASRNNARTANLP